MSFQSRSQTKAVLPHAVQKASCSASRILINSLERSAEPGRVLLPRQVSPQSCAEIAQLVFNTAHYVRISLPRNPAVRCTLGMKPLPTGSFQRGRGRRPAFSCLFKLSFTAKALRRSCLLRFAWTPRNSPQCALRPTGRGMTGTRSLFLP